MKYLIENYTVDNVIYKAFSPQEVKNMFRSWKDSLSNIEKKAFANYRKKLWYKNNINYMLKEYYNSKGIDKVVILDAMKGGVYIDELKKITQQQNIPDIRNMFSPDLINLAWTADLIYRYEKIVKDYLQKGYYVILHRSDICCRVYSRLFGNPEYAIIVEKMLDDLDFVPDIRIFLDIDPDLAYGRLIQRNNSDALSQKEKLEYLKAADEIYKDYIHTKNHENIYVINAELNRKTVFNNLLSIMCI